MNRWLIVLKVAVLMASMPLFADNTNNAAPASPAIPPAIDSAVNTSMQSYVQRHLPPDPAKIFTCTAGDTFCETNEQAWTAFTATYSIQQAGGTNNYYPNQPVENGPSTTGASSSNPY